MMDFYMDLARKKFAANPPPLPVLPKYIETPADAAFNKRLDEAIANSEVLLREAREQLAKPIMTTIEETEEGM